MSVGLQHHLVGDHQVLLDGLDEDLGSKVTGNLSDVHILRECCPPESRYVDICVDIYILCVDM